MKRVRVGLGGPLYTAGLDNVFLVQYYRYGTSTAGAPTTVSLAGTSSAVGAAAGNFFNQRDGTITGAVPTGLTVKVKAGTTACVIGTTSVVIVDQIVPNGRALYEWLARDDDDMYRTTIGGFFCVALSSPVASQVFTITADFVV